MISLINDPNRGCLVLIPTPIDEDHPLESTALQLLHQISKDLVANQGAKTPKYLILVEDHKIARRRWLRWGLTRDVIEAFRLFNEHSTQEEVNDLALLASQGCKIFLMSDCGLPAVFDPGQQLVDRCLDLGVTVTSTPFPNSILLALALSGFVCAPHYTLGFLPRSDEERTNTLSKTLKQLHCSIIFMDTPYRYGKVLSSLAQLQKNEPLLTKDRQIFIGKNLNQTSEQCLRFPFTDMDSYLARESLDKPEFVIVISQKQV